MNIHINAILSDKFTSRFFRVRKIALSLLLGCVICAFPLAGFCEKENAKVDKMPNRPMNVQRKASPEDILIVQLADNADREKFDQALSELKGTYLRTIEAGPTLKFLLIQAEPGQAAEMEKRLKKSKDVTSVECNRRGSIGWTGPPSGIPSGPPTDPLYGTQWNLGFVAYPQARMLGNFAAPNQTVYMYFLDTGATTEGMELGLFSQQRDFTDPTNNPNGVNEWLHDTGTHGTMVTSVTSTTNNGIDLAGAANFSGNRVHFLMCRISKDGQNNSLLNIVAALSYIANNQLPPGPINISAEENLPYFYNANPIIQQLGKVLKQEGQFVIFAAGNKSVADSSPDGSCRRVASISENGRRSTFSNYGAFNCAAPGNNIPVMNGWVTGVASGTSFAAPLWCAAIADVMPCIPEAFRTAAEADYLIRVNAIHTADGYLVPNIALAIDAASTLYKY